MIKDRYRYWDIYDELPDGWKIDKTCGSPMARSVFITDGVPPLYGCKRAILRIKLQQPSTVILDKPTITTTLPSSVLESKKPIQYSLF